MRFLPPSNRLNNKHKIKKGLDTVWHPALLSLQVRSLPYLLEDKGADPQRHVSLRVSRSCIVQRFVPGGLCIEPVPDGGKLPAEMLINTLRSGALCVSVNVLPTFLIVPTPVKIVPLQHQR